MILLRATSVTASSSKVGRRRSSLIVGMAPVTLMHSQRIRLPLSCVGRFHSSANVGLSQEPINLHAQLVNFLFLCIDLCLLGLDRRVQQADVLAETN